MSFKTIQEIAINFCYVRIKQFHKIGSICHTVSLYYIRKDDQNKTKKYALPVNIVPYYPKQNVQKFMNQHNLHKVQQLSQAFLHQDNIHYVSRSVPVKYSNKNFIQNVTCYFKIFIDTEIIDNVDIFIQCKLIFKPFGKTSFYTVKSENDQGQVISTFVGKINKNFNVFSYLPISFDSFQAISIVASYQSIISEFKFSKEEQQEQISLSQQNEGFSFFRQKPKKVFFTSFKDYLSSITDNFSSQKIKTFYKYYRNFLVSTYESLKNNETLCRQILSNSSILGQSRKKMLGKNSLLQQQISKKFPINNKTLNKCNQLEKIVTSYRSTISYNKIQQQQNLISEYILQDFSHIRNQIFKLWTYFNTQLIQKYSFSIIQYLKQEYNGMAQQRYKNNIFSHKVKISKDHTYSTYDDSGNSHIKHAQIQNKKKLSTEADVWTESFMIQDMQFLQRQQKNIKFFQQIYEIKKQQLNLPKYQQNYRYSFDNKGQKQFVHHIIFLVHGFGATKTDLLLLKYCIEQKYPKVFPYISISNIGKTQDDIEKSGNRLAEQVKNICDQKVKDQLWSPNMRISFIGHSMGGLIIRSAMQKLQKFKQNFHTYISICTPHLGYLYEPSSLIKIGIWFLNQMQKHESINQIQMKDNQNWRKCYLYRLTLNNGLKYFKNIAFLASSQDSYVPYESARIQKSPRIFSSISSNPSQCQIIQEMINNLLVFPSLKAKQISRIDVVFNIEENNLDSFIGRTGHIKFLSDQQFIKEFVMCFKKFFI